MIHLPCDGLVSRDKIIRVSNLIVLLKPVRQHNNNVSCMYASHLSWPTCKCKACPHETWYVHLPRNRLVSRDKIRHILNLIVHMTQAYVARQNNVSCTYVCKQALYKQCRLRFFKKTRKRLHFVRCQLGSSFRNTFHFFLNFFSPSLANYQVKIYIC
jgi:hypothetical protein